MFFDGPCAELATMGLDKRIALLIALASLLITGAIVLFGRRRPQDRSRLRTQPSEPHADNHAPEPSADSVFAAPGAPLLRCHAELMERRPLSEAQWDSPVPAAWTIFRLRVEDGAETQLGLLLPIQHKEAYSSGFIERLENSAADTLLLGFAKALGGPVPGPAITGSSTGFLEFKTYVQNEKPEIVPGNLDLAAADYWIFVKIFVQNTLDFYLRVNPHLKQAEIAAGKPAQGEELMRVLAATLRPEVASS